METNENAKSSYFNGKQIGIVLDYYNHTILTKFIKNKKRFSYLDYFDTSSAIKLDFYSYYPYALPLLNLFNFESIIRKKIFYSSDRMRDTLTNLFKLDLTVIKEDIMSIYRLAAKTIKSILFINFHPLILVNCSLIYSLGFLNFIKRNYTSNGLTNIDYTELFFIAGLGTIPFTNFLQNFYLKKYIHEEKIKPRDIFKMYITPHRNFGLVCLKSISDNFLLFAAYFSLINKLSVVEKDVKTLHQKQNYPLFKEMTEHNETFKRIEVLYIKDETILTKFDISIPIVYTTLILTVFYTPLDYVINFMLNNNLTLKQVIKNISNNNPENNLYSRSIMFQQYKSLMAMNLIMMFMKYGLVLNNYEDYFNRK